MQKLAAGLARKATARATSSGVAEAAERDAAADHLVELGPVLVQLVPRAAGEVDRAGRDGVDPDALRRQRVAEAGRVLQDRGLERGVGVRPRSAAACRTPRSCRPRRSPRRRTARGAARPPRPGGRTASRSAWKLVRHWSGPLRPPADTLETTTSRPPRPSAAAVCTKSSTDASSATSTAAVTTVRPCRAQLVGERLERLDAARAQREVAALGREQLGDRAADAAAGAGDDGLAAGQLEIHAAFLRSSGCGGRSMGTARAAAQAGGRRRDPGERVAEQAAEVRVGEGVGAVAGLQVDERAAAGRLGPADQVAGRRVVPRRAGRGACRAPRG